VTSSRSSDYLLSADFIKQIKNNISGAYFLFGKEDYMKSYCVQAVRKSISSDNTLALMNTSIIDMSVDSFSSDTLSNSFLVAPIMCEKHLIELRGLDFSSAKKEKCLDIIEQLCEFAKDVDEDTIFLVVFSSTGADFGDIIKNKPNEYYKKMAEFFTPVCFEPETRPKLITWISKHFIKEAIAADLSLCEKLLDRCGTDMYILENEINKLCNYLHKNNRNKLEEYDIQTICSHNTSFDDFDFSDAILNRDSKRAFEILNEMKLAKEAPELISASIITIFTNMLLVKNFEECGMFQEDIAKAMGIHAFRVKLLQAGMKNRNKKEIEVICDLCMQADEQIKNAAVDKYIVLDRLLGSIFQRV